MGHVSLSRERAQLAALGGGKRQAGRAGSETFGFALRPARFSAAGEGGARRESPSKLCSPPLPAAITTHFLGLGLAK